MGTCLYNQRAVRVGLPADPSSRIMFSVAKGIPQPVKQKIVHPPGAIGGDSLVVALGMTLFAFCVGCAINLHNGYYDRRALVWLTLGLAFGVAGLFVRLDQRADVFVLKS